MSHVHTDLVRASRFQPAFNQCRKRSCIGFFVKALYNFVMRDCFAGIHAVFALHASLGTVCRGTPEWRIDRAAQGLRRPQNQRQIGAFQRTSASVVGKLIGQMAMCQIVLGNHHDAGRILVEPMHDAWPFNAANAGKAVAAMVDQRVDERSVQLPAPGCTTRPAGLAITIRSSSS